MYDMTEAQIASLHAADRRARDTRIERAAVAALVPTFADEIRKARGYAARYASDSPNVLVWQAREVAVWELARKVFDPDDVDEMERLALIPIEPNRL